MELLLYSTLRIQFSISTAFISMNSRFCLVEACYFIEVINSCIRLRLTLISKKNYVELTYRLYNTYNIHVEKRKTHVQVTINQFC